MSSSVSGGGRVGGALWKLISTEALKRSSYCALTNLEHVEELDVAVFGYAKNAHGI